MKRYLLNLILLLLFWPLCQAENPNVEMIEASLASFPESAVSVFNFNESDWEWTGHSVVKSNPRTSEIIEEFAFPNHAPATSSACVIGQSHLLVAASTEENSELWAFNMVSMIWKPLGNLPVKLANPALLIEDNIPVILPDRTDPSAAYKLILEQHRKGLHPLDYAVMGFYFLVIILIGILFARKEDNSSEGYFVGNRKMPTWAVGLSLYATGTSAISMMAIPAKAYATNWLYMTAPIIQVFSYALIAIYLVPLVRRLNITSVYEYLEMRFSLTIRLLGSATGIILQVVARMGVTLYLPALALSAVTGASIAISIIFMGIISTVYTVLGGIKAVIWTDVFQVVILLGGGILSLIIVVTRIDGGLGGLIQTGMSDNKFQMLDFDFNLISATVWVFLIFQLTEGATWVKDQVMMQRVFSTKDDASAGRSIWVLNLIALPGSLLFFSLGTALYVFYKNFPAKLDIDLSLDATFPYFVVNELPMGITGLIIAALFAASMSSLDSSMNSVASLAVVDFYARLKKRVSESSLLKVARNLTVVAGILGTAMALLLSTFNLASLFDTFISLVGIISGAFGGVFMLGLFTRTGNSAGALTGCLSGVAITIAVQQFTGIHFFLFLSVGAISCFVIGFLVSMATGGNKRDLTGLTFLGK